ncbi:MAG TPA: T9SS type A sorting domain-containing protein [Chitinophagaceae bacterium]|nr:T9SS type A sorting domain-containing protein [Chitinophagaceae bacterium]
MKKFLPVILFFVASNFSFSVKTTAQSSCPQIINSTFRIITNQGNQTRKRISFDYINPSNGNKRISVLVTVNGTSVVNVCVNASNYRGVQRTYTTPEFTVTNMANMDVTITPYTASNCGGSACAPTIRSVGGAPLPVIFSAFTLARNNATVSVKWETATEISNSGFNVEKFNSNNEEWEPVAFVRSKAEGGNSSNRLSYEYNDINNSKAVSQYRIKQVDINGEFKYSEVRTIRGMEQDARTMVFPNPSSNGTVNVVFAEASVRDIILVDMAGRTIKQWNAYSNNSLQLNNLVPGMYTLRSFDRETATQQVQKIVINGR